MGKIESTKVIRVWILGALFCATIFLALSARYDFWAMKVYKDQQTGAENTTYFGLWKKCFLHKGNNANGISYVTLNCEKFGEGGIGGIEGVPGFIKLTRGFLILMVVVIAIATILCGLVMLCSRRALMYITSIPTLVGTIVGIIILGIFLGKLDSDVHYDHYVAAWTYYYFLFGWFFTISAFIASLVDRPQH